MKSLQLTQNRLLRVLNQTKLADKVSTESMLNKFKLLSVNQLAAEIKLIEVWKSIHDDKCPLELDPYNQSLSRGAPSAQFHETFTAANRYGGQLSFCQRAIYILQIRVLIVWP